jgi:hypothetical protein
MRFDHLFNLQLPMRVFFEQEPIKDTALFVHECMLIVDAGQPTLEPVAR